MKEIFKFQDMTSAMVPKAFVSFLSVSCWFQISVLWMSELGTHPVYVCGL